MPENMILSECEEINSLLYKPIATTQRIKYTCLNVSVNYIVLGSTSGSLYLFIRESCVFQQLIPLSEGPVSCVVVSPDEKTIALATKRGSVCLIAIKPTIKLLAVSSEHLGESVTSLCWNDNSTEIYIGDGIGKISTMLISIFTVNGMFQAPSCALMHLDSSIVQMQFSLNLLLVSTITRCYICDTSQEQFKQIGNKARDGEFGACFMTSVGETMSSERPRKDENESDERVVKISETNGEAKMEISTKIYCARPGYRLWEVTCSGTVVKTHQFKEALAVPSSSVYRSLLTKITKNHRNDENRINRPAMSTNFSHLHVLRRRYLFSHSNGSIYIVDPTNAAIILWNDEYTNIAMARTIDDKIYLMMDSGIFHCLRLAKADDIIMKFWEKKNYRECLRACKTLKPEYMKIKMKNNSSRSANDEREEEEEEEEKKAADSLDENYEISLILAPIISLIQSRRDSSPIKLNSGIVLVNSGMGKLRLDDKRERENCRKNNAINEGAEDNFQDIKIFEDDDNAGKTLSDADPVIIENFVKKRESTNPNNEITDESFAERVSAMNINEIDSFDADENLTPCNETRIIENATRSIDDETALRIQNELKPIYELVDKLKPAMSSSDMENVIIRVRNIINRAIDDYGKNDKLKDFLYEILRSTELRYCNVLLENVTCEFLRETRNSIVVDEILRSFVDINGGYVDECICGYRYPNEISREPKFHDIGEALLVKFFNDDKPERCVKLCNSVDAMWRFYLKISIVDLTIHDDTMRMCLRTGDSVVLSTILPLLDVRQWEIAVKCIRDMENGICPCCDRINENFKNNERKIIIDWSKVARELMKREGTTSAMTFLVLVETVLPNVRLDKSIFQSLIFTKILDRAGLEHSVNFDEDCRVNDEYGAMCSPKVQEQLLESIERDLERPAERNIFGAGAHHWGMRFQAKSSTCPCCTLSLHTPVLLGDNGISLFPCGHAYHVNCLIQRKLSRCNLHK